MDPSDVRSMCPLRGDQKVLVLDDFSQEWHISSIENLFKGHKAVKEYTILLNGQPKRARLNRFDNLTFYKVRTINGHEVVLSHNHANLVFGGSVKTTDQLTTTDYLPFNITPFAGSESLTYEDGLMVGAFMGDGSLKDDYSVVYSLNETTKMDILHQVMTIAKHKYGAKYKTNSVGSGSCINLTCTSKMLRGLIEDYVSGKALTKELNPKCIGQSLEFRRGIIDGLLQTDGDLVKNRIYTASDAALKSVCAVLASMGIPTRITTDNRTSADGKLSDTPIYCIRMYSPNAGHAQYGDVYVKDDEYMWFRIESIEPIVYGSTIGYCFEVLEDDKPYFMLPSGLTTHNCRLRLDLRELRRKAGGFFGSGDSTGSVGVVTLNIPRLAYLAADEEDFYKRLDKLMDIAARSLKLKRTALTKFLEAGLYPYAKEYLGTFENHFSTLGLVGVNEACLNAKWLRCSIADPKGKQFAVDLLNHMRNRLSDYQEKYSDLYNLEATPAESTAYRFAMHDKKRYPDIITAGGECGTPYYTNSTNLPVDYTEDIFSALDHQDDLHVLYTSGTVFHAFQGEKLPSWEATASLVRKIAENYKLPYFSMSPTYSICKNHGYLDGEQFRCPECGESTEVYSRITGYYRPVQNWNDGKVAEYKNRKEYTPFKKADDFCESCQIPDPLLDSSDVKLDAHTTEDTVCEDCHFDTSADDACDCCTCETHDGNLCNCDCECHDKGLFLIATKECPKCKLATEYLTEAGINFTKIYAEDDATLVHKFGLTQAPVLIDMRNDETKLYTNLSDIRKFIEQ